MNILSEHGCTPGDSISGVDDVWKDTQLQIVQRIPWIPNLQVQDIQPLISQEKLWQARQSDAKSTRFSWRADNTLVQEALSLSIQQIQWIEQETKIDISQFCLVSLETFPAVKTDKDFQTWWKKLPEGSKPSYIKNKFPLYYKQFKMVREEADSIEIEDIIFRVQQTGSSTWSVLLNEFWDTCSKEKQQEGIRLSEFETFCNQDVDASTEPLQIPFYYSSFVVVVVVVVSVQDSLKSKLKQETPQPDGNKHFSSNELKEWYQQVKKVQGIFQCNWKDNNTWSTKLELFQPGQESHTIDTTHLRPYGYIPTDSEIQHNPQYFMQVSWGWIVNIWSNHSILLVTDHCTTKPMILVSSSSIKSNVYPIVTSLFKQHILKGRVEESLRLAYALLSSSNNNVNISIVSIIRVLFQCMMTRTILHPDLAPLSFFLYYSEQCKHFIPHQNHMKTLFHTIQQVASCSGLDPMICLYTRQFFQSALQDYPKRQVVENNLEEESDESSSESESEEMDETKETNARKKNKGDHTTQRTPKQKTKKKTKPEQTKRKTITSVLRLIQPKTNLLPSYTLDWTEMYNYYSIPRSLSHRQNESLETIRSRLLLWLCLWQCQLFISQCIFDQELIHHLLQQWLIRWGFVPQKKSLGFESSQQLQLNLDQFWNIPTTTTTTTNYSSFRSLSKQGIRLTDWQDVDCITDEYIPELYNMLWIDYPSLRTTYFNKSGFYAKVSWKEWIRYNLFYHNRVVCNSRLPYNLSVEYPHYKNNDLDLILKYLQRSHYQRDWLYSRHKLNNGDDNNSSITKEITTWLNKRKIKSPYILPLMNDYEGSSENIMPYYNRFDAQHNIYTTHQWIAYEGHPLYDAIHSQKYNIFPVQDVPENKKIHSLLETLESTARQDPTVNVDILWKEVIHDLYWTSTEEIKSDYISIHIFRNERYNEFSEQEAKFESQPQPEPEPGFVIIVLSGNDSPNTFIPWTLWNNTIKPLHAQNIEEHKSKLDEAWDTIIGLEQLCEKRNSTTPWYFWLQQIINQYLSMKKKAKRCMTYAYRPAWNKYHVFWPLLRLTFNIDEMGEHLSITSSLTGKIFKIRVMDCFQSLFKCPDGYQSSFLELFDDKSIATWELKCHKYLTFVFTDWCYEPIVESKSSSVMNQLTHTTYSFHYKQQPQTIQSICHDEAWWSQVVDSILQHCTCLFTLSTLGEILIESIFSFQSGLLKPKDKDYLPLPCKVLIKELGDIQQQMHHIHEVAQLLWILYHYGILYMHTFEYKDTAEKIGEIMNNLARSMNILKFDREEKYHEQFQQLNTNDLHYNAHMSGLYLNIDWVTSTHLLYFISKCFTKYNARKAKILREQFFQQASDIYEQQPEIVEYIKQQEQPDAIPAPLPPFSHYLDFSYQEPIPDATLFWSSQDFRVWIQEWLNSVCNPNSVNYSQFYLIKQALWNCIEILRRVLLTGKYKIDFRPYELLLSKKKTVVCYMYMIFTLLASNGRILRRRGVGLFQWQDWQVCSDVPRSILVAIIDTLTILTYYRSNTHFSQLWIPESLQNWSNVAAHSGKIQGRFEPFRKNQAFSDAWSMNKCAAFETKWVKQKMALLEGKSSPYKPPIDVETYMACKERIAHLKLRYLHPETKTNALVPTQWQTEDLRKMIRDMEQMKAELLASDMVCSIFKTKKVQQKNLY